MKKTCLCLFLLGFFSLSNANVDAVKKSFGLKKIMSGYFSPKRIPSFSTSSEPSVFYQSNSENSAIYCVDFRSMKVLSTVFDCKTISGVPFTSFQGFEVSEDGNEFLIYTDAEKIYRRSFKAQYYYFNKKKNVFKKLTVDDRKQTAIVISPKGGKIAYVIDNNIWISEPIAGKEVQITFDGKQNKIINGRTDWVYEEEFEVSKLMCFSPDGTRLAYVRTDESKVPMAQFPIYANNLYVKDYAYKYPKPGEKNSSLSCHIYNLKTQETKRCNLSDSFEYLPKIEFLDVKGENTLLLFTLNRDQNCFKIFSANEQGENIKPILTHESRFYFDSTLFHSFTFTGDGFIMLLEKDNFVRPCYFDMKGSLLSVLTEGNFTVIDLFGINREKKELFYQAAYKSPMTRSLWKVSYKTGKRQRLSEDVGMNSARMNPAGTFFIKQTSSSRSVPVVSVCDDNGKVLKVLENNEALQKRLEKANLPQKEFITLLAADGKTKLNGFVLKPKDFEKGKKYPLVMIQYSGPNSQQVLDTYSVWWEYALLNEGFAVACFDGRGTGARGEEFCKQTYLNLGIMESDDQAAVAKQLGNFDFIDGKRIALWGWSFGGYNVLMTLGRHPGVFRAGVAIAPVTSWRYYDSVYTERFMRTPSQNQKGYENTSALNYVSNLSDRLLLMHGTADDNVLFQNSAEYLKRVVECNKYVDTFIFPDMNHSINGGNARYYVYTKCIQFFKQKLKK